MNVHDWLANLPFRRSRKRLRIMEVSFTTAAGRIILECDHHIFWKEGEMIAVERSEWFWCWQCNLTENCAVTTKEIQCAEESPDIKKVFAQGYRNWPGQTQGNQGKKKKWWFAAGPLPSNWTSIWRLPKLSTGRRPESQLSLYSRWPGRFSGID